MSMATTSDGLTMSFPDVCLTPPSPPGSPVPVPYPNLGGSSDDPSGSKDTKLQYLVTKSDD
ncbi:MAG: DUF4150 domain-containing protein [Deltaproteobacteria bacterium]|nr:DUF4150 domain-containing protein [Deltaproteobacteria bacterium]MBW2084532.1 DUF4150 domain-containing protein [Deltaproteobacteria bacterium]